MQEIRAASEEQPQKKHPPFFTRRLRYPILYAFLIAAFNQLSGINIILYFAPRLLDLAGLSDPLLAAISLGITNFIFTLLGVRLIDKLGRKTLLLIGCAGYILSLAVCTYSFVSSVPLKVVSASTDVIHSAMQVKNMAKEPELLPEDRVSIEKKYIHAKTAFMNVLVAVKGKAPFDQNTPLDLVLDTARASKASAAKDVGAISFVVLACMILFIASHAIGSGTIIWVFISEIFPTEHRAAGQSLGSSTHWIFAAALTLIFPIVMAHFDAGVMFGFFCSMMCVQLVWAVIMMPETKGQTLEALAKKLVRD